MRHSIILKVGENLIYQKAPTEKPRPEISSTPVEYNRALPEWERTAVSCLIRPSDQKSFAEYIDKGGLLEGVKVPHELVEIYEDGDSYPKKKYARMKGKPNIVATEQTPNTETLAEPINEKYCEIYRDEKGELFVKCKNVSMLEMKTAEEEFLHKERRENAQPKEDAIALVLEVSQYCSDGMDGNEKQVNAKEVVLIFLKKLMVEDALVNPKRLQYLEKVKAEILNL